MTRFLRSSSPDNRDQSVCARDLVFNPKNTSATIMNLKASKPIPIKTCYAPSAASIYPSPTSPTGVAFQTASQTIKGFPLSIEFTQKYLVGSELGFGGFGFVYSATRISDGLQVACKFIYKSKIVRSSWTIDKHLGRVPMEVAVLKNVFLVAYSRFAMKISLNLLIIYKTIISVIVLP
jgi:hypothetical protein